MTWDYVFYGLFGIILTAALSAVAMRMVQIWGNSDFQLEKKIKEHEDRNAKNEVRIEGEITSLKNLINKLEELIHEVRSFISAQNEKNHNWTQQIDLLWLKHNENRKEINDVKDRVTSLEYKAKYGREYRKEN